MPPLGQERTSAPHRWPKTGTRPGFVPRRVPREIVLDAISSWEVLRTVCPCPDPARGQAENTLADDVLLNLVGTAVDRRTRREHCDLTDRSTRLGLGLTEQHAVGADDLQADLTEAAEQLRHRELADVGLSTGALLGILRPLDRKTVDLDQRVELDEFLTQDRVGVLARLLGHVDQITPQAHAKRRDAAFARSPLVELGDGFVTHGPHARASSRRRRLAGRAKRGPLEHQCGVGNRPTLVEVADDVGRRDTGFIDEDLVEERLAGHLDQRTHGDARLVHVDREVGDALVLRGIGIGSGDQHAHVGDLAARRPDLLAGDDVLVTVLLGLAGEAGEVRTSTGLGEQLAPADRTVEDRRKELVDLLLGAVGGNGRGGEHAAQSGGRPHDLPISHGGHHRSRLRLGEALAVGVGAEHRVGIPARAETVPPVTDGEGLVPVLVQPRLHFGADLLDRHVTHSFDVNDRSQDCEVGSVRISPHAPPPTTAAGAC